MFISHEDVLWSKQGDLNDPAWCLKVGERLRPECVDGWKPGKDPLAHNLCTMLIIHLQQLPPLEKAQKIGHKLHEIAASHNAEILRIHWWDIGSSKRHLYVHLRRPIPGSRMARSLAPEQTEMYETAALLMWKKSEVAASEPRRYSGLSQARPSWAYDREAPGGWRFEIECEIFEHIKVAFDYWLASPLPPLPRCDR